MKTLSLLLLCSTISHVACLPQPPSGGSSTSPSILARWSGTHSDVTSSGTRTLRTAEAWEALWKQVQREQPRPLDPAREMALAIFPGERRTGGYTVEIVSISAKDGQVVVEYRELTPAPDMMVTQALTQPWVVAIVTRTELPVVFQKLPATVQPRRE